MTVFSTNTKVEALRKAPLFEGLARRELIELAKVTDDLEVEPGKVLCKEGQPAREFFVIVDGEVEVRKRGKNVTTLGPGDFFGEIALIEHGTRTATVTAKTPLRFFVLHSRAFNGLMDSAPGVERKVLRALARRVLGDSDPTL